MKLERKVVEKVWLLYTFILRRNSFRNNSVVSLSFFLFFASVILSALFNILIDSVKLPIVHSRSFNLVEPEDLG